MLLSNRINLNKIILITGFTSFSHNIMLNIHLLNIPVAFFIFLIPTQKTRLILRFMNKFKPLFFDWYLFQIFLGNLMILKINLNYLNFYLIIGLVINIFLFTAFCRIITPYLESGIDVALELALEKFTLLAGEIVQIEPGLLVVLGVGAFAVGAVAAEAFADLE